MKTLFSSLLLTGASLLTSPLLCQAQDNTPPVVAITAPADGTTNTILGTIAGWATDNSGTISGISFSLRESNPAGTGDRYWNGTAWQGSTFWLPATLTGTNWSKAASVSLPPLNSGMRYRITANATDPLANVGTTSATVLRTMDELTWDPGTSHVGTQIRSQPHTLGGPFVFKLVTQGTSVGGWRSALNVIAGEANLYLRSGQPPTQLTYDFASTAVGSDGWVLPSSQFNASEAWFFLVDAAPGATWNLVTGEPFVLDLGELPNPNSSGTTNVPVGAERWRFFRTTPPAGTLAWQLYLNGSPSPIYVRKDSIPLTGYYDKLQSAAALLVPDYVQADNSYYVAVPGNPGQALSLTSKQQPVVDLAFDSSTNGVSITGFPYRTYRVSVPIDQIAWEIRATPTAGDANVSARRAKVPNEWENDAFSEVPGSVEDSFTLVPPWLSDGTFYLTTYAGGSHTYNLRNGEPTISPRPFVGVTTNDAPTRAGWRFYVLTNLSEQIGYLGWELDLSNHVAGTEIALRRNAVPGRWFYRANGATYPNYGAVDYSGSAGFLQRPGHQADIWYIGLYEPETALGSFHLRTRTIPAPVVGFSNSGTDVAGLASARWTYFRIDVPADAEGWYLRLTNVTAGTPQLAIRRDLLPDAIGGWLYGHGWTTGAQTSPTTDATGLSYRADGVQEAGQVFMAGQNNPVQAGTYYVGVRSDAGPASFRLSSRGIGASHAIGIHNLAFNGPGSRVTNSVGLPGREADYYRLVVPSNAPNWLLHLTPIAGEACLAVQQDYLPNNAVGAYINTHDSYGKLLRKVGRDYYLLLPGDGMDTLPAQTNYLAVISQGISPDYEHSRLGNGSATYVLESLGSLAVNPIGTGALPTAGGGSLTQHITLQGGQISLWHFAVPAGVEAMQLRLLNRVGNPACAIRPTASAPYPHVPAYTGENYGADGGWLLDRRETTTLLTWANPTNSTWSLTLKAERLGDVFADAECDVEIVALASTNLSFNGGLASVHGHASNAWRYFRVVVPPNALGWDLRLTNVTAGLPRMSIRKDLRPDNADQTTILWNDWPEGGQCSCAGDLTSRPYNADGSENAGRTIAFGMSAPLTNGTYYVGIFNGGSEPASYSLFSRGIGPGMAIPVVDLPFASGNVTNSFGLPAREVGYYRVVVPPSVSNWAVKLAPTGSGEALLVVHPDAVPPSLYFWNSPAQVMQKPGNEIYSRFASQDSVFLQPGTNYLAVVSEGIAPAHALTTGTGNVAYTLRSGTVPVSDLGVLPLDGPPILRHVALEGGEVKLFRLRLTNTIPAVDVVLSNRTANPVASLIPGTNAPCPQLPWFIGAYGVFGGHYTDIRQGDSLVSLANAGPGEYSLALNAMTFNDHPTDAELDLLIIPRGPLTLDYADGSDTVTGQAAATWRHFKVTVPDDSEGWELRVTDVVEGSPQLYVRRDAIPADDAPSLSPSATSWPSGYQLGPATDWTALDENNGASAYGHYAGLGRNNPLEPGVYYVSVHNNTPGSAAASYTLRSRGVGGTGGVPVTPLSFAGGTVTPSPLPARHLAYYRVEVPDNAPGWKLRVNTSAGGDSRLVVHRGTIPSTVNALTPFSPDELGKGLAKAGNEHYLLLPAEGTNAIPGGTYYIAVISDGVNPNYADRRIGVGDSAFTLESSLLPPTTELGQVPSPGSMISWPLVLEGGEVSAYRFRVPGGAEWVDLRLANRSGNPSLAWCPRSEIPHPSVPISYYNPYGADGGWVTGRREDTALLTLIRPGPTNTITIKAEFLGGIYPDAAATIEVERRIPVALAYSNGVVAGTLANNQRTFYRVTVPPAQIGWRLDLSATNGTPTLRARKDLLPSDDDPAMVFGGPTVILAPPFLEAGTWYVEVKGGGLTDFQLRSGPVVLERPAWSMPAYGGTVTSPGLPASGPVFGDSGVGTNGTPLPGDQGVDLGEGDFHFYAINVPMGNAGLLRVESLAISGNPDIYIRRGGVPTFHHNEYGYYGAALVDYQLAGIGTEYGNFVPLNGRTETQLGNGIWYLSVRANGSNIRYRLRLGTGSVAALGNGSSLSGQVLAGGDWRYYRIAVPSNAPASIGITYSQQQGDVEMYVRDTIPPGEPADSDYRHWGRDNKNGGPYAVFRDAGSFVLTTPPLRPGTPYYLGFRAVGGDASFSVSLAMAAQTIDVTNVVAFYGGSKTVSLPPHGAATFRVPVPADATSWRHQNVHSAAVGVYLDQGTLPDLDRHYRIWENTGPNSQAVQFLSTWPWVANQHYFLIATNTSATPQSFTLNLDGRNAATDDTDGDGLPDGWEILYFGNLNQGPEGDPDGDLVNNAAEFAEGTNPAAGSSFRPRLTAGASGGGNVLLEPNLPSYALGQLALVTAMPDAGLFFNSWSGDATGVLNPLRLTMDNHKTVTANFSGEASPLVFSDVSLTGDRFTASISGPAGATLVVFTSADLTEWTPIATNAPFTGNFIFVDPAPPSAPGRAYRARLMP